MDTTKWVVLWDLWRLGLIAHDSQRFTAEIEQRTRALLPGAEVRCGYNLHKVACALDVRPTAGAEAAARAAGWAGLDALANAETEAHALALAVGRELIDELGLAVHVGPGAWGPVVMPMQYV